LVKYVYRVWNENLKEERTLHVYIRRRVIEAEVKAKLARGAALCTPHQAFSFCLENIHSDWHCECTPNTANVFETGITLPGRSRVSLPAATP
jgi:hypothetical protein